MIKNFRSLEPAHIDVVHVTFKPPFVPGSYNRMIGVQMERMPQFEQRAISYWDGPPPSAGQLGVERTYLATPDHVSFRQRMLLALPYRWRRRLTGTGAKDWLTYIWQLLPVLQSWQPKVVICYDAHHLGSVLRQAIDWPCRLVLSQHGLSYYLDTQYLRNVYSVRSFDAVHVLSRVSYRTDRQRLPGYEPEVTVVPNWVDADIFTPASDDEKRRLRAKWGLPVNRPVVLWLSRLVPSKGAHLLIASWRRVLAEAGDAVLWIVGGSPAQPAQRDYASSLRQLVQATGLADHVRFAGEVRPELTPECYRAADVYVFPTLAAEGCGLTLLEAMACGLPCVASDYPVGREMFSEREVLFAPEPNLAEAFASPIVDLLNDADLREQLGFTARQRIEANYSYDQIAPRIRAFYERQLSLVGMPGRGASVGPIEPSVSSHDSPGEPLAGRPSEPVTT